MLLVNINFDIHVHRYH